MPNLITDVATTDATVPDVKATTGIQQRLAEHGIAPGEHYPDSGYPSADLVTAAAAEGITMVTPLLADHSRQAKAADGFDKSAFHIDWTTRQVRCPQGHRSTGRHPVKQHRCDAIVIEFAKADYRACPARTRCTAAARGNHMPTLERDPRESRRGTHGAEYRSMAGQVCPVCRDRGHRQPSPGHHRDPPGPLPRPGQGQPPTRLLRHRDQHHPARRPLDRHPRTPPRQPPRTPGLPPHHLTGHLKLSNTVVNRLKVRRVSDVAPVPRGPGLRRWRPARGCRASTATDFR